MIRRIVFFLAGCTLLFSTTVASAGLNTVADYTFDDNMAPAGFTETGAPSYAGGRVTLDGTSYLQGASPTTAVDNVVLEAIVDATAVGAFNFAASISNADSTNSGYGILAQSDSWHALTSNIGFPGSTPHRATPTGDVAIAYVRNGGDASLYVNGIPFDSGGSDGDPTIADAGVITIGGHEFDAPNGLFVGSIDRVRVSTFDQGGFLASDLLAVPEPVSAVLAGFAVMWCLLISRRRST